MAPTTINGWSLISGYGDPRLTTGTVPGTTRTIRMHRDVLPLFLHFASKYHTKIAPIDKGQLDDWGYAAPRTGRASTSWSDHSSGTALDLNAAKEGAQGPGNLAWWQKHDRAKTMTALVKNHKVLMWGGATICGGSYKQPQNWDWMHVAIKPGVSLRKVRRTIKKLRITPDGTKAQRVKVLKAGLLRKEPGKGKAGVKVVGQKFYVRSAKKDAQGLLWLETFGGRWFRASKTDYKK